MSDLHLRLEEQLPRLMRYAGALTRDDQQALDLVEDTIAEAIRLQPQGDGALRVRLLTILHEQRSNPFRQADPLASLDKPAVETGAALTLSNLDRALAQLDEAERAVILLIGLEGLSYEQTAAVLGISLGAMRSRLRRGRDNLCRLMGVRERRGLPRAA